MNVLTSLRRLFRRHPDLIGRHYAPEPGSGIFRDPRAHNTAIGGGTLATGDAPTIAYEPHGIDTPETLAEIARRAQEDADTAAALRAAQASAMAQQWGERDEPGPAPLVPVAHEPPPMPPSALSRIMVSQIPSPPPNDRNFEWTHKYADYMRRVGVATGTSTDWEHTMTWGLPALEPGDGTGEPL